MQNRVQQLTDVYKAYKQGPQTEIQRKILADAVGYLLVELSRVSLNEYQLLSKETAIYPKDHALDYCTMKLTGESGEFAEKVAKMYRDDEGVMTEERRQALKMELGDVLWYVAALARELDFSLEEVAKANLDKLMDRKQRGKLKGNGDSR